MNLKAVLSASLLAVGLSACTTVSVEPKDYTAYHAQKPASILIVPVINHTNEVDAAELFYSTLTIPLAERGYYVFPAAATRSLLQAEGLGDAGLIHETPTPQLAPIFGADAVLYLEVLDWESEYEVISSSIETEFLYTLKSGTTGEVLWQDQERYVHSLTPNSGNIFADLIASAVTSLINNTKSDFTPLALSANVAVLTPEGNGLPFGPRSPYVEENDTLYPATGSGKLTDAQQEALAAPGVIAPAPSED